MVRSQTAKQVRRGATWACLGSSVANLRWTPDTLVAVTAFRDPVPGSRPLGGSYSFNIVSYQFMPFDIIALFHTS